MLTLIWSPRFKSNLEKYIKKHPDIKDLLVDKLDLFVNEPYNPELRNHKPSGRLSGLRAIVIAYDCRIIFEPQEGNEIILIDVGDHDDVY